MTGGHAMDRPADAALQRLRRLYGSAAYAPNGDGRTWHAFCPSCGSAPERMLSVVEGDDGRVALWCYQGCEPEAIRYALEPDALEDMTLAEILERQLPAEEWVVRDLIAPGTIGFLHGLPETFKTFLALHVALGVAEAAGGGAPRLIFGKLPVELGGPVGYVWQDDSEVEEMRRIKAVAAATAARPEVPAYFLLNRGLRVDRPEDVDRLGRWIARRGLRLVVLDSLKDFVAAGSTKDDSWVTPTINGLKALCDEHGVAMLIVHHDAKPSADTKGRAAGQTMHGSVFLEAGARSGLHFHRPDHSKPEVNLRRWGNSGRPWGPDLLRLDEDTCEVRLVELAHNRPKVAPAQYLDALREAGGGMFVKDVAARFEVSEKTAKKHLEAAGAEVAPRARGKVTAGYAELRQGELTDAP